MGRWRGLARHNERKPNPFRSKSKTVYLPNQPPGTVVCTLSYPFVVMRDRVGYFVVSGTERHDCKTKWQAQQLAKTLKEQA